MPLDRAALLKQIAESSTSGGGNYIRDSRGRLCVSSFKIEEGFEGTRLVISFYVVASQKIPVFALSDHDGYKKGQPIDVEPYPTGASVNECYMLGDPKKDPGFGRAKAFVLALYGFSASAVSPNELIEVIDELDKHQTARGMIIDYETRRLVTKEKKLEIVVTDFKNVPGSGADGAQTAEDIARYTAWMEQLVAAQPAPTAAAGAAPATA